MQNCILNLNLSTVVKFKKDLKFKEIHVTAIFYLKKVEKITFKKKIQHLKGEKNT